jgi:RimJ/RimL family protein N-acetyltransferase
VLPVSCSEPNEGVVPLADSYPSFDLVIRTPRVELRGATDDLLAALLPIIRAGIYDPEAPLPFDDPMSLYDESPEREYRWLRAIWAGRSRVEVDEWWRLYFVVIYDGKPIGMQDLTGVAFRTLRTVTTFSWLGRDYQRIGLGREARAAVLHLAFDGLEAQRAESEAFHDNHASNRVSQVLGYVPNGVGWATRRGEPAPLSRWLLTRERWEATRRDDITVAGLAPCRDLLGL